MDLFSLQTKLTKLGLKAADWISWFVSTWRFVFIYSGVTIAWVVLHVLGVLHFDTPEFMKYNLFLAWFAGTQASIILMSAAHSSLQEKKRQDNTLKLLRLTEVKIDLLMLEIERIESKLDQHEDDLH